MFLTIRYVFADLLDRIALPMFHWRLVTVEAPDGEQTVGVFIPCAARWAGVGSRRHSRSLDEPDISRKGAPIATRGFA